MNKELGIDENCHIANYEESDYIIFIISYKKLQKLYEGFFCIYC